MSRAAAATPIQSGYMWKEGEFLSKWKSDPKFVTFSIKSRCLQYRHSDSVSEPAYKTVSLLYASYVRELPLVHEALLDCLTPGQALAAPSEMLSESDVRLPPFAFEIGTPGRVLRFRAPTADALRAWVDALAFLLSAQCYRRAFQVLHAGKLLLRCGGSLADLFFKSFETRSALLCPRFLLVFDTQAIGEAFVEHASAHEDEFVEAALRTPGVKVILVDGAMCAEAGEIDGQAHCFVLSCARPDGNASKMGDQYEFACRNEQHLQVWTDAIAGELGAAAQQEKEFKKAAKAAYRLEKALKSAQKEMKKEDKKKKRTASDPPASGAAVAAASATKAEPVAVTVKPSLNRTNTFREVNLPSFDTTASPHAAAKSASAPHPPPSPSAAAPAPAPAAHSHSPSATESASSSSFSPLSSSHLNSHLASMLQSRQQARDDHDSEVARRQQRRLRQMAQDELIRARADAEQAELRDILSATVCEWAQRHRNDMRQMINHLHEVFAVREGQYAVAADALPPAVRRVYHRLLLVIHPDRNASDTIEKQICATVLFAELRNAFEIFEAWMALQEEEAEDADDD